MSLLVIEKGHIKVKLETADGPLKICGYDGIAIGYSTTANAEKLTLM
jgi:hypothetical protein